MTRCSGWRTYGLTGVIWVVLTGAGVGADTTDRPVTQLTDAELVKAYETAGLALAGTGEEPTDAAIARVARLDRDPRIQAMWTVKAEILRRGAKVVPALLAFLEQEAPKEREKDPADWIVLSFTGDALELLARIGDPRAAPLALRVLEGWEGKVNKCEQWAAIPALEKLTHFSFHRLQPFHDTYADSVEHPDAMAADYFAECATPARLYKEWMAGEGSDPATWVRMAMQRAWQLLASENLEQVYCAAEFLRPAAGHDEAPGATLARLAEIVGKTKKGWGKYNYKFAGRPLGAPLGNWVELVADYGPRARPYVAVLLRIQKEQGRSDWTCANLRKVGGPEVMAFLFEALPRQRGVIGEVQVGIARWAGRRFDSDADCLAWWEANKHKMPQEWLAANLDVLVEQADRNPPGVGWLAREVLPDLPVGASEDRGFALPSPDVGTSGVKEPFRVKWLQEHRRELRYDENAGCFRLAR